MKSILESARQLLDLPNALHEVSKKVWFRDIHGNPASVPTWDELPDYGTVYSYFMGKLRKNTEENTEKPANTTVPTAE